jgi:GNAT superfamily N-acetyltransferase
MLIEVRRAVSSDAQAVSELLVAAFERYRRMYTRRAFSATAITRDQVLKRFGEGPSWVAIAQGCTVGCASALPQADHTYVRGVAVLPAFQGMGIAYRLLQTVRDEALSREHHVLRLSTTPFLTDAIRMYRRFGFVQEDRSGGDLFGTPLLSFSMNI